MKLPVWFKGASIRRKLLSIIFLAIGAATLFTMIVSTFLQWFALRDELVMNISSKMDIIASNVAGELNSNNREAAEKTLKALENIDSIEFAGILDVNGDSFALYVRPGYVMPAHQHPFGKGESHIHTATYIETAVPVHLNQEPLGLIHIRSDMSPVYRKLAWNIWITLIAAAGSIAVAVIILLRSLSAITKPLHRLVGVMAIVSRDNNFALRAELHGNDELGTLAKGFNGMLEQIQMRDNALGQKYTSLEADVAKRTVDLQESNRQLETELAERRAVQEELKNTNEELSILLDSLPIAVYRCRADDFSVLYMSQNVESFTGYKPEDFIGKTDLWFSRIHPEDEPRVSAEITTLFEKGAYTFEYRWQRADGTYLWLQDSLKLIRPEFGTTAYIVGMWQEITERKQAGEKLYESELAYRTLTRNLPGIVYRVFVREGNRMAFYNDMTIQLTGYKEDELSTGTVCSIEHLILDEDLPQRTAEVTAAIEEKRSFLVEYRLKHKNDTICWMSERGMPVFDEAGTLLYLDGMIFDITDGKETEEVIRRQQRLTSQIIEAIPLRIFWKDQDLHFLGCNTLFAKDAGLSCPDDLIGKSDFDMAWQDQAERYRSDDRLVMDSNTPKLSYDEPQSTPHGEEIWVRSSKVPLHNAVDETIGMLGVYDDITVSKQMEFSLLESEQRFRSIAELASDAVWQIDQQSVFVYFSEKVRDILGYEPEELIGKTPFDLMPPEEAVRFGGMIKGFTDDQKPFSFLENINIHKDGHRVVVEVSGLPMIDYDGIFQGYFGIIRDISERTEVARVLEESELKFRSILDTAADGVAMMDAQTRKIVTVNRAICDMLGYEPEEMYGLGVEDLHPAETLPDVLKQFERQMKGEIKLALNSQMKRKDGSVLFSDISAAPLTLGERHYSIGIFHDATERRQAEEEIRKVNEELEEKVTARTKQLLDTQEELVRSEKLSVLGQVAGSVGHELRNPLGVMSNAVYFLQTVLPDADDSVKEYLGIIKNEITASERIVSDLLDSVRTKEPQPGMVSLAELIGQTLRKLEIPSSVVVNQEIPETLPLLMVDAQQIHQVLRNLISNGVEAMPEGGTLEIRAVVDGTLEKITLGIHDNGVGMTPEQLGKLFQPLFTTKARGIGLGLIVVKNLIEANGGSVKVESEAGKGTLFTVTLPAANENGLSI
jgi:PAS domain S-box-containing protein